MMLGSKGKPQLLVNYMITKVKNQYRDFPDGPVAKTLCSQYRGPGCNPWSVN